MLSLLRGATVLVGPCRPQERAALLFGHRAFSLGFIGLVISNVPYLVPDTITVWQAAAAPSSQLFMLVGTLLMLPIILGYTAFVYWTFRGKVRTGEGYQLKAEGRIGTPLCSRGDVVALPKRTSHH